MLGSQVTVARTAFASVIANVGIVVTGGAVRLTGSGLGCPTWPRCTEQSYAATPAMGVNGAIEFGNRLLTFAVGLIALAVLLSALRQRPRRRRLVMLAALVLVGIPAQAVVGGISVLTDLNPWVVGVPLPAVHGDDRGGVRVLAGHGRVRTRHRALTVPRPAAGPDARCWSA